MTSPRLLFAGTPDFALASLAALIDGGIRPLAVLTQPDRPAGRGKRLTASPVKRRATDEGIPVLQPTTLREAGAVEDIRSFGADLLVVAAYGLLLPQAVLDVPARGCLNVHASLLPRWRGAAPIQAAILAGDAETGISLMAMTAGLDCGPVYGTRAIDIGDAETAGELHDRLAALGGEFLVEKLPAILAGDLPAVPQDEALATHAGKIRTADAELDWSRPAAELARQVRAYNPAPGAWFDWSGERVKCWKATAQADGASAPGAVTIDAGVPVVACGDGTLRLELLQRPGRRPVTGAEFARLDGVGGARLSLPAAS